MHTQYIERSAKLIRQLGYTGKLHTINLEYVDGSYSVDYNPCTFLRNYIETGVLEHLVDVCNAFHTFSDIENHPFTNFINTTNLYGENLNGTSVEVILSDYENWFEVNKNNYAEWC